MSPEARLRLRKNAAKLCPHSRSVVFLAVVLTVPNESGALETDGVTVFGLHPPQPLSHQWASEGLLGRPASRSYCCAVGRAVCSLTNYSDNARLLVWERLQGLQTLVHRSRHHPCVILRSAATKHLEHSLVGNEYLLCQVRGRILHSAGLRLPRFRMTEELGAPGADCPVRPTCCRPYGTVLLSE